MGLPERLAAPPVHHRPGPASDQSRTGHGGGQKSRAHVAPLQLSRIQRDAEDVREGECTTALFSYSLPRSSRRTFASRAD